MSRFFTPRFLAGWLGCPLAVMTAFTLVLGSVSPSSAVNPAALEEPTPQDVFAAIQAGDLEVGVVPQNERRLTIQMKNKTDRPLTIVLPPALAAAPILAQQPGGLFGGGFNPPGQNGQQQSPQQVGMGMNGGNGNNGGGMFPGGMFNIPAGRAIKIKAETVCLEYGKPNPDVRMKYELKPLADVCDKPELIAVLTSLGKDQINQRSAQAVAWHLTNDLSWDELARLVHRKVGSTVEMQFKPAELAAAKAFVEKQHNSERFASKRSLSETPKQPSESGSASASAWASSSARGFAFGSGGHSGRAFQSGFGGGGGGSASSSTNSSGQAAQR